ncbi:MAG TPA: hypothetical protein VFX59_26745 [Polyangiales bacterium]|nr:hypothetical protein [Polyangiales bacterium]
MDTLEQTKLGNIDDAALDEVVAGLGSGVPPATGFLPGVPWLSWGLGGGAASGSPAPTGLFGWGGVFGIF